MSKIGSIQISLSTQKDIIPSLDFFFELTRLFAWTELHWLSTQFFFIFIAQIPSLNLP